MNLDIKTLADIDKLYVQHENGDLLARFGFVVTLFFEGGGTLEKRLACLSVVRDYCERFREEISHYQKMDGNRLLKTKNLDFLDGYERKTLAYPDAEGVDYAVFGFEDGADTDGAAFWTVAATASAPYELSPADVSHIDLYLPASWVDEAGLDVFVDLVSHWCSMLKPIHGTAGLGTLFSQGNSRQGSDLAVFPLIKRFPGLDYNDSVSWKSASGDETKPTIRVTNWLNILCNVYLDLLGGRQDIENRLTGGCSSRDYEGGVILRAGTKPQLGDINQGLVLEDYKTVARILKPLRFEDFKNYTALFTYVPQPLDNLHETLKWLRRFD